MSNFLNIGSGQRPFDKPWLNVDCQKRWEPDIVADGANLPMFCDASQKMICLHHVLEHYNHMDARLLVQEAYRLLEYRGSLLVFVPDMWEVATMWKQGRLTDPQYFSHVYGAYMGDEADTHKWGYTYQSLVKLLEDSADWGMVRTFDYRFIPGAKIAGGNWILGLEAIK